MTRRFSPVPLLDSFFQSGRRLLAGRSKPPSEFTWETLPSGPSPRLDAGAIQIGSLLYCVGGYVDQSKVLSVIDVWDLENCIWSDQIPMPANMPQSHIALASDGRFIYSAGGQLGPHCCRAVADAFVFDTHERSWRSLPRLPEARYAPTMQLWQGRLHVMGGAKLDRSTPATEHWSLGVDKGHATDTDWRVERPIPRGGGHRASAMVNNRLYLLGGQEGDFEPISNDPNCACTGETIEYVFPDCFRLDSPKTEWVRLPDMLQQSSHTEFSILLRGPLIIISGGSCYKDPQTFNITLTDVIQQFDTRNEKWSLLGHLPFRVKTTLTGFHDGWIYASAGQRDRGPDDPRPGIIESGAWRARLNV